MVRRAGSFVRGSYILNFVSFQFAFVKSYVGVLNEVIGEGGGGLVEK